MTQNPTSTPAESGPRPAEPRLTDPCAVCGAKFGAHHARNYARDHDGDGAHDPYPDGACPSLGHDRWSFTVFAPLPKAEPILSPVALALEKARESARVAELDLRAALLAIGIHDSPAFFVLLDLVVPQARIAERLSQLSIMVSENERRVL